MVGAGNGAHGSSGSGGAAAGGRACRDAATVALDLEALERRVQGCEKADHLLQVGRGTRARMRPRRHTRALLASPGAGWLGTASIGPGSDLPPLKLCFGDA